MAMAFPIFMMGLSVVFILGFLVNYEGFTEKRERIGATLLISLWILNFLINTYTLYEMIGGK